MANVMKPVFRSVYALPLLGAVTLLLGATPLQAVQDHPPLEATIDSTPVDRLAPAPASFAPIVKKAEGSVVNIFTTKKVHLGRGGPNGMLNDQILRYFFGDPQDGGGYQAPGGPGSGGGGPDADEDKEVEAGMGSGVIISSDGYILTNNHVIAEMDGVKVKLQNGDENEYTATVIGSDPQTDVALLKVDAKNLPAITLGDSSQIEVGDRVFAIGNPFGVGQTVTSGIISGTNRNNMGITDYENFIQTDASINPGNSGGALVDIKGRLIGVNSAILSRSGGSQGVGLAVPVNLAWGVVNALATGGKVDRGYLGVAISGVSPDVAQLYGLEEDGGAMVTDVVKGTPAAEAGLRPGDVITKVNGVEVSRPKHLTNLIGLQLPGATTKLEVNRQGKKVELNVNLGNRDEDALMAMQGRNGGRRSQLAPQAAPSADDEKGHLRGLQLAPFDTSKPVDNSGYRTPPPADLKGVVITKIVPGSSVAAKLAVNDVILEIDHQTVTTVEEARKAADGAKEKPLVRYWSAAEGAYGITVLD